MKDEILSNLDNPAQLEKLYRTDKPAFRRSFNILYPELKDNTLVSFWNERLNFAKEEISWGSNKDLIFVIVASLIAGLIAKLPSILNVEQELFYSKNIGFIIFPALTAYFAWKNKLSIGKISIIIAATLIGAILINTIPCAANGDTLQLSCIHLPLILWSVLGFAFVNEKGTTTEKRLGFLSFNGDLIVMTTLILIAGALLTGITNGLFSFIGVKIEKFYQDYIFAFALPAAPILGTYLTRTNPQLVGKVSPVIAKIFSPLVLVTLVIYLIAIFNSGKDPYNDREFLIVFNALLVGVMALIFFSVAEASKSSNNLRQIWILFLLSAVTVLVNVIALSAIWFRISEWGITPNRAAILCGNMLILINLLVVTVQLFRVLTKKVELPIVGKSIAMYLPVYTLWAIIVTFIFPLIFGYR